MSSILVINAAGRETRVALVENGHIAEFYLERKKDKGIVGNIYKGRVVRVLPGMQAAFVDIGLEKAAFLYVNDVVYDPDFAKAQFELTEGEHDDEVPDVPEMEVQSEEHHDDLDVQELPPGEVSSPHGSPIRSVTGELPIVALPSPQTAASTAGASGAAAPSAENGTSATPPPATATVNGTADAGSQALPTSGQVAAPADGAAPTASATPSTTTSPEVQGAAASSSGVSAAPAATAVSNAPPAAASVGGPPDAAGASAPTATEAGPAAVGDSVPAAATASEVAVATPPTGAPPPAAAGSPEAFAALAQASSDAAAEPAPVTSTASATAAVEAATGESLTTPPAAALAPEVAAREDRGERRAPRDQRHREKQERRRDEKRGRDRERGGRDRERGDRERDDEKREKEPRKTARIEDLLKVGQEVVVQASKDPIGTKGARLTSHISIPGRHLVFMPTVDHIGISRRIANDKERRRLRDIVERLRPPGTGFIVRTVAENVPQEKLESDIRFLIEVWNEVVRRNEKRRGPGLLHPDLDLILRATRDLFAQDVEKLVVDEREEYERIQRFVEAQDPALKDRVVLHDNEEPVFDAYGIEQELKRATQRKVWLKSGGYLIMDQAEALTAIDVNSGRYVGKKSLEETITKINVEAAKEIVYQLRLRNIGGIIICDFIDMEKPQNRDKVFKTLQEALGRDKAKTNVLRISELGLVEMTRKRVRESIGRMLHEDCSYCDGKGYVKTVTTVCYEIFREIRREAMSYKEPVLVVSCHPDVARMLQGEERNELRDLMDRYNKSIQIKAQQNYHREQFDIYGRPAQQQDRPPQPGRGEGGERPDRSGDRRDRGERGDRDRDRGDRGSRPGGGGGGDRNRDRDRGGRPDRSGADRVQGQNGQRQGGGSGGRPQGDRSGGDRTGSERSGGGDRSGGERSGGGDRSGGERSGGGDRSGGERSGGGDRRPALGSSERSPVQASDDRGATGGDHAGSAPTDRPGTQPGAAAPETASAPGATPERPGQG